MSSDATNKPTAIQRSALRVVRAEMRLYDRLAATPRLRVEYSQAKDHASPSGPDIQLTRRCAHNRALHDTCVECGRDEQDCVVYRRAAMQRLKDLLSQLGE